MRRGLPILLLLGACAADPAKPPAPLTLAEIGQRATPLGQQMRAAQSCGLDLPASAQDRAARIEATAIALQQMQGGVPARDAFLHSLEPPRQRPRDRAAWCQEQMPAIARSTQWLDSAEGEAFAQRAEALLN
jgi:hypothetical protein